MRNKAGKVERGRSTGMSRVRGRRKLHRDEQGGGKEGAPRG